MNLEISILHLVGGIPTPLKSIKVNGKDGVPYMKWKIIYPCSKPPTRCHGRYNPKDHEHPPKKAHEIPYYSYKVVPPSYVCWFIIPLTIDISPINHSEIGVMFTNLAIVAGGTTLYETPVHGWFIVNPFFEKAMAQAQRLGRPLTPGSEMDGFRWG